MKSSLLKIKLIGAMLLIGQYVNGQQENALDFDGIDDHVVVSSGSGSVLSLPSFSMACWVYPTNAFPSFPNFDGIIGFRNDLNADFYIIQLSATSYEARLRNSAGTIFTITANTCQLNTWQHLALVYTGTQLHFYHNGLLTNSVAASGTITNGAVDFKIGRVSFTTADFNLSGKIDEVGLWGRALSDTEVNCLAHAKINPAMPGLLNYYSMDVGQAGGINTSINFLPDNAGNMDGFISGFALTGATSNFVSGVSQLTTVNDTICSGDTYVLGGQSFNSTGNYRVFLPNGDGCDSAVALNLVVKALNTSVQQVGHVLTADLAAASYQWLDCGNGFAAIPGANTQQFVPTVNGQYAVRIDDGNCVDTSLCFTVTTVGFQEQPSFSGKVFPNPGSDQLTIQFRSNPELPSHIVVFDALGRIHWEAQGLLANEIKISTESWAQGSYLIRLQNEQSFQLLRWIKQ